MLPEKEINADARAMFRRQNKNMKLASPGDVS
jgi:hypothetical protein